MKRLNLPKRCKIGKFTLVVDFYKDVNFDQAFGLFVRSMKDSRGKSSSSINIARAILILLGERKRASTFGVERGAVLGYNFAKVSKNSLLAFLGCAVIGVGEGDEHPLM